MPKKYSRKDRAWQNESMYGRGAKAIPPRMLPSKADVLPFKAGVSEENGGDSAENNGETDKNGDSPKKTPWPQKIRHRKISKVSKEVQKR